MRDGTVGRISAGAETGWRSVVVMNTEALGAAPAPGSETQKPHSSWLVCWSLNSSACTWKCVADASIQRQSTIDSRTAKRRCRR